MMLSCINLAHRLHANVVYVPDITPAPSSLLRQVAYGQNMIVPRPDVDPSGWHALPPTTIKGRLSSERKVKLQCTVSPTQSIHH